VLALFLDVVVDMWDDYRRNNMEPISICTVRQINRRKTTTINKEYRLRNLLEMAGRASWELEGKVSNVVHHTRSPHHLPQPIAFSTY
jgi:hypothetical protein